MDNDKLNLRIRELEERLAKLETRRILQQDIINDVVKMRHIGEGVRYIRGGVTADKPTAGEKPMQGNAVYYDETAKVLYIWNNSDDGWDEVSLT
jgi:hypothetical protein